MQSKPNDSTQGLPHDQANASLGAGGYVLTQCAAAMPTQLATNCYRIMAQLTEHILSPERAGQPITPAEVNSLYKLSVTIGKLKTKPTLNESMEMFAGFTEYLSTLLPELAASIAPLIDAYITSQASAGPKSAATGNFTAPNAQSTEPAPALSPTAPIAGNVTIATSPAPSERDGVRQAPKCDIRKQLRGTATKGPGKAWRQQQAVAKAQAAA